MSGGKETGRQKMVGMMYLVLTALLALNVSNTIIDKFVFINESLVSANNETQDRNIQIMESIVQFPMDQQYKMYSEALNQWMGDNTQMDDILLMAFEYD